MPISPGPHAIAAIVLVFAAIYLFTREKGELETSSLIVLIAIVVWFELFELSLDGARVRARDVFAGFGSSALISIVSLMIVARGLERTGALQPISHLLAALWQVRPRLAFLLTLVTAAVLSMFLNNTPVVAAVLPLLIAVSLRANTSPAAVLMPVGFATIVGGMATTIGTSTNLLVTGIAADLGVHEFGIFDFALPVVVVGSVAILYLWLIAPRLLPDRRPPLNNVSPRVFTGALEIAPGGFADGRTIAELRAGTEGRLRIARIMRRDLSVARLPSVVLRAGDVLYIDDTPEQLKTYEEQLGAKLAVAGTTDNESKSAAGGREQVLAEIVVSRGSVLYRRTLNETRVLEAFGILPLALHRPGQNSHHVDRQIGDLRLNAGDIVLIQGTRRQFDRLKRRGQVLVLDGSIQLPRTSRATPALIITICVVAAAASGLVPIVISAFCGFALMLAFRCLTWQEAVAAVDRRIILVIVASLALGLVMMASGAAEYVATVYVTLTGDLPVAWVLAGLILIIALLTEVVTNNAVAVLGTPIAINVANQLGAPAEPFILAVLYGANMSYLTPVGYQTNLLVLSAGAYRFSDFFRAGLPLQVIMWLGLALILPVIYDL